MKILLIFLAIALTIPLAFCERLAPADFEYVGAFRLPLDDNPNDISRWAYGGYSLAYDPNGDPNNVDDFSGSLFGTGHLQFQAVSEISIPAPVISRTKNAEDLPVARTLQSFTEITQGLMQRAGTDNIGGIAYKDGLLYWTIFEYYNVAGRNHLSHGVSNANLANLNAQGVWRLGSENNIDFHAVKTAGYLTTVPDSWSNQYAPGMTLASGRQREAGAFGGSRGPPLFVFRPEVLSYGASLQAIPLMWYNHTYEYPSYSACDHWKGLAWVTAANASAVVITGRKGLGETYYGVPRANDCSIDKGYHCTPYESQILLYDTDELGRVAQGYEHPYDVAPYAIIRPTQYFWGTCQAFLGGATYDDRNRLLYVVEIGVDTTRSIEPKPLIHVFKINHTAPITPPANNSNNATIRNTSQNSIGALLKLKLPVIPSKTTNQTINQTNQTNQTLNTTLNTSVNSTKTDYDGDGFFREGNPIDCNDNNTNINPNATEIQNNSIDDDCNSNTLDQTQVTQQNANSAPQTTSNSNTGGGGLSGFAITYRNQTNTTNTSTSNVSNTTVFAPIANKSSEQLAPIEKITSKENPLMNLLLGAITLTLIAIIGASIVLWNVVKKRAV